MPANNSFEPTVFTIKDLLDKAFEVPCYQRPYSWKAKDHVMTLVHDIDDAYKLYKVNWEETYYTGAFYYKYLKSLPGGKECYDLIDGQQRITTYSLMFLCLLSLSKIHKINDINSQFGDLEKNQLWKISGQTRARDLRFLTLNSLDKDFFQKIFDKAFDEPKKLRAFVDAYAASSTSEKRIKENFLAIYDYYDSTIFSETAIADGEPTTYLNFLLSQIKMIGIRTNLSTQKIFEMFESINSKFKPLDDIDLIKTYIFKHIKESEYEAMLSRWSELVKGTDDNLEDYLKTYVRAFVFYYNQDITIKKFSESLIDKFKSKHGLKTEAEAVLKLVEELERWLPAYQMLTDIDTASEKLPSKEFETFFRVFHMLGYEHPKPLLLLALAYFVDGKATDKQVIQAWKASTLYMLIFKSIMNQDSKSSIGVFGELCGDLRDKNGLDVSVIVSKLNQSLLSKSITTDKAIAALHEQESFGKPTTYPILALLHSIDIKSEKERQEAADVYSISRMDYSMAITYLQQAKKDVFEIDHIMHQTPEAKSPLKYRVIKKKFANEYLELLDGHDFPEEIKGVKIEEHMSYKAFKSVTINRLGNLRLITKHSNISRGNKGIYLIGNEEFATYKEMKQRGEKLASYFFGCPDLQIK